MVGVKALVCYKNVPIPEGKEPKDYTVNERRAEMLRLILEAGHPRAITHVTFAKRYGKHVNMIVKDLRFIKEEIVKDIGSDAEVVMEVVFEKAIKKLVSDGKPDNVYKAAMLSKEWYDWLFSSGRKVKSAERQVIEFVEPDWSKKREENQQKKKEEGKE